MPSYFNGLEAVQLLWSTNGSRGSHATRFGLPLKYPENRRICEGFRLAAPVRRVHYKTALPCVPLSQRPGAAQPRTGRGAAPPLGGIFVGRTPTLTSIPKVEIVMLILCTFQLYD